jgi:hypothetical protein
VRKIAERIMADRRRNLEGKLGQGPSHLVEENK